MRIPVVPLVFLFVFMVVIDWYIAWDIRTLSKKKFWPRFYWVTAFLCWAFLIVTISLPRREASSDLLTVMWMLYSFLTLYVGKLAYMLSSGIGRIIRLSFGIFPNVHPFKWFGLCLGLGLMGAMWIGAGYTRRHIERQDVEIFSQKLPQAFDGYRIVQISDLHVGTWGRDTTFISTLVDSVNNLKPDLIVFTGDIVNRQTSEIEPFLAPLSRLRARDGVFSIFGNHDYGDYTDWKRPEDRELNNRLLAAHQNGMGWTLLNNERVFLKNGSDSIMLIGVENIGDPPFPSYGDLGIALSASPDSLHHQNDDNFKILLTHNPAHWDKEVSKSTNIDLTLSGHTHAMQMMLRIGKWKWSPAKYRYEQWGGLFERPNYKGYPTRLYVNTGAGEVGMPSRLFNAYPEITLITLEKERDTKQNK